MHARVRGSGTHHCCTVGHNAGVPLELGALWRKWLYKHMFYSYSSLAWQKARWVVRGFSEQVNINYDETFGTIVKLGTIHIVLKIIASRDWPIHQLVVKNTFLHGHLGGPCTTSSRRAMWTPLFLTMFVSRQKSLYGPKQAPWLGTSASPRTSAASPCTVVFFLLLDQSMHP